MTPRERKSALIFGAALLTILPIVGVATWFVARVFTSEAQDGVIPGRQSSLQSRATNPRDNTGQMSRVMHWVICERVLPIQMELAHRRGKRFCDTGWPLVSDTVDQIAEFAGRYRMGQEDIVRVAIIGCCGQPLNKTNLVTAARWHQLGYAVHLQGEEGELKLRDQFDADRSRPYPIEWLTDLQPEDGFPYKIKDEWWAAGHKS